MNRLLRLAFSPLVILLIGHAPVFAQAASTASIAGTVRDAGGGVLPGVSVTATQAETGLTRSVVSDENGGYLLTNLPVGPYRLEFSLNGFRTSVQTGIVLHINTNPTINTTLQLGDLAESIVVESQSPLIETRSPGIGFVIDNERVQGQTLDLVYVTMRSRRWRAGTSTWGWRDRWGSTATNGSFSCVSRRSTCSTP